MLDNPSPPPLPLTKSAETVALWYHGLARVADALEMGQSHTVRSKRPVDPLDPEEMENDGANNIESCLISEGLTARGLRELAGEVLATFQVIK